jgi:hypothetical protein
MTLLSVRTGQSFARDREAARERHPATLVPSRHDAEWLATIADSPDSRFDMPNMRGMKQLAARVALP